MKRATRSLALLTFAISIARVASAAGEMDLDSARKLFTEALSDEDHGDFAAALDKFTRVKAVRDTTPVRYRIATCLEGLGRLRDARDSYAHASEATVTSNEDAEVARASGDKLKQLDARIPVLTIRTSAAPPADLDVEVDGAPVHPNEPVPLDPGDHALRATGAHLSPYETSVHLAEGGTALVVIPIAAREEPKPREAPNHTLSYVAFGVGGAFVAASIVTLFLREGDIHTLQNACPNDVCPNARHDELQSAHDHASLEGPLAIGFGAVGLLVAGAGAYLLLKPQPSTEAPVVSFSPIRDGGMFSARGSF